MKNEKVLKNVKNIKKVDVILPKSPGMKVVKVHENFDYKNKLSKDSYGKNDVRFSGTSTKVIKKFVEYINNGNYQPEHFIAPTITKIKSGPEKGKYNLDTGNHRRAAHELAKKDTMYVIEIEFYDYDNKPAAYWRKMWKINENEESEMFIQNPRDKNDVVGLILDMINSNMIQNTPESIDEVLRDAKVPVAQSHTIRTEIFKDKGHHAHVVESYPNFQADVSMMMKDDLEGRKMIAWNILSDKFDSEHDNRMFNKLVDLFLDNPDNIYNTAVIAHVSNHTSEQVINIRKKMDNAIERKVSRYQKFIDAYKNNKVKIPILFRPQLNGENAPNKPKLIKVRK